MKFYSHIHLILQRDVLALCSGEAKARTNIVQAFFKIVLVEAWLTKSLYNELWGTIYSKGRGDPCHSPLWPFNYPHDSSPTVWLLHSLLRLDLHLTWINITMHMYPCEQWLEQAKLDTTLTYKTIEVQLFDILMLINSDILVPRLVVSDSVRVFHCDICLEPEPCLYGIRVHCLGSSVQLIWRHAHHFPQCGWTSNILAHDVSTDRQV